MREESEFDFRTGVNRSLKRTIASIREMSFEPLERAGAQVDVLFHTYTMRRASSHHGPPSRRETNAVVGGPFQEFPLVWKLTLDAIERIQDGANVASMA